MRKRHFFALFGALLLLLSLSACKKDEKLIPNVGSNNDTESSATTTEEGDTDGSSTPFSIRFDRDGTGFDTESGLLFTPTSSTAHDFTNDLNDLRNRMDECNAFVIGRSGGDLTYKKLSGGSSAVGDNSLYTIRFTADGETYTITIDDAAIDAYRKTDSDVSNIDALVSSFVNLTDFWNGSST